MTTACVEKISFLWLQIQWAAAHWMVQELNRRIFHIWLWSWSVSKGQRNLLCLDGFFGFHLRGGRICRKKQQHANRLALRVTTGGRSGWTTVQLPLHLMNYGVSLFIALKIGCPQRHNRTTKSAFNHAPFGAFCGPGVQNLCLPRINWPTCANHRCNLRCFTLCPSVLRAHL